MINLPPGLALHRFLYFPLALSLVAASPNLLPADEQPRSHDPRLVIEQFASDPQIVHPIGATFDNEHRLLVIESHTHFPPADYEGPKHDRIRVVEDTSGDGRADRFTTFFEGTRKSMDVAAHPDGSIYLATRNEILRLRDTTGDGRADAEQQIVFLDTTGDYPHNGLSGLSFDEGGNLYFGLGENLGVAYTLRGSDGREISDQGEGGNIFWCTADGRRLRRVATGFWNPFGVCRDVHGRTFAVDNDPDASPPCRLMHVINGGDYGYQFRYGRSGRHPFQAWNGQLAGTLPMMAGVGEGPCEVISYESDGLPGEYRGDLLVASWAEHRLERYRLEPRGASYRAERLPMIEGGDDFRPVGIAVAPDGSLYITDWVLRDYKLHGRGRIWHVRMKEQPQPERPDPQAQPLAALASRHRRLRERAARTLASQGAEGRAELRKKVDDRDARVRTAALAALLVAGDAELDLRSVAKNDPEPTVQATAVRALAASGKPVEEFLDATSPQVLLEAVAGITADEQNWPRLEKLLDSDDPFLRRAAVRQIARTAQPAAIAARLSKRNPEVSSRVRQHLVVALQGSGAEPPRLLKQLLLHERDPQVRFLAIKWVADKRLAEFRPALEQLLAAADTGPNLYYACVTALARLDGKSTHARRLADDFVRALRQPAAGDRLKAMALRFVPPDHKGLDLPLLRSLIEADSEALQLEALRTMVEHRSRERFARLAEIAQDKQRPKLQRAWAIVGLAHDAARHVDLLLSLAEDEDGMLAAEALRALTGSELSAKQKQRLESLAAERVVLGSLVQRVVSPNAKKDEEHSRTAPDVDAWLTRHARHPADPAAGERIFFSPRVAACSGCHRVGGRGADVGPDLSLVGRSGRRRILESILDPAKDIAPHFQTWALLTEDGRTRSGMLVRTHLDRQTYVDTQGRTFEIDTNDLIERKALATSIMPEGVARRLTPAELRDLLAFLETLR